MTRRTEDRAVCWSIYTSPFPFIRRYNFSVRFLFNNCQYHISNRPHHSCPTTYRSFVIYFRSKLQSTILVCKIIIKTVVDDWFDILEFSLTKHIFYEIIFSVSVANHGRLQVYGPRLKICVVSSRSRNSLLTLLS